MATLYIPIDVPIPTGNTLWVDAVNGDDATGVSDRQDRPFLTLTAAKTAATAGDLIRVRPGTYDEKNLLKNGANWYFEQGSKVIYTGATNGSIFDDGPDGANGPVVCTIDGFGEFEWTNDFGAATTNFGVVHIQNAGSNVVINGLSIENSGNNFQYGWTVLQEKGLLTVNMAQKIHSLGGAYNLGWYGGTGWINTPDIQGTGNSITWIGDATGGDWYVNSESIIGTGGDIMISTTTDDTVGALWITAKLIKGDMSTGVVSGISGKVYISAQKMWNTNASAPVVNSAGLFLWATVQKMTAESGQFFRCEASSGTVILEVQQYESKLVGEVVSTYGSIYNEGANLTLIGGVMTITNAGETQKGLEHVDGTTLVKGMTFDLTGNDQADSYPVLVSGAGLTLENCTLKPPSGTPSVGGSSVSFLSSGGTVYEPLQATVTVDGDLFYDDGADPSGKVSTGNADGTWSWAAQTGGGAVDSVNGETGAVVLDASDVGADPAGSAASAQTAAIAAAATDATTKANAAQAASQPLDSDLTAIAALTPANDDVIQRKAGSWVNRTMAQLWADLKSLADLVYAALAPPSFITYTGGSVATTSTSFANVHASASLAVPSAGFYEFQFLITYQSAATTTGARFGINGTMANSYLAGVCSYSAALADRGASPIRDYDAGGAVASSFAASADIPAVLTGFAQFSGAGTLSLRFATSVGGSAITVTALTGFIRKQN
jgi:hypothetical protein